MNLRTLEECPVCGLKEGHLPECPEEGEVLELPSAVEVAITLGAGKERRGQS